MVAHWKCIGSVLVVCWGCTGGALGTLEGYRCLLEVYWWCIEVLWVYCCVLGVPWWCTAGVLVVYWWCSGGVQVVFWRCVVTHARAGAEVQQTEAFFKP